MLSNIKVGVFKPSTDICLQSIYVAHPCLSCAYLFQGLSQWSVQALFGGVSNLLTDVSKAVLNVASSLLAATAVPADATLVSSVELPAKSGAIETCSGPVLGGPPSSSEVQPVSFRQCL